MYQWGKAFQPKGTSVILHHVYEELQLIFCSTGIPDTDGKMVRNDDGEVMWGYIIRDMERYTMIIGLHPEVYGKPQRDVK